MKLLKEHVSRFGVYFFYDKDGIVDRFVTYMLDDLYKAFDRLIIVCNGTLTKEGKNKLKGYTDEVIVRENKGLDVWAYKTALERVGWSTLETYDEIVLLNSTIMGPVYPFSEMFEEMDRRDVDFWGITKFGEDKNAKLKYSIYDYIPEHIQSHFMVFRHSLVSSRLFQQYWDEMPEIHSYDESIGIHESAFTKKFSDMGYKWDVYIDTDEYKGITTYPLNFYAKELIINKRCPIFKRRSFFQNYDYVIANTVGQSAAELFRYLKVSGLYDVDMILENILRNYNQEDIVRCLHLNYIISSKSANENRISELLKKEKVALIMHLHFPDLIKEAKTYASFMPKETDIYITTNTSEKKQLIEEAFVGLECSHFEVRVIENRGRDVSSLLVGMKDIIGQYDLACFAHDKKTSQVDPGSVGMGFAYKCYSNTLYNKEFVNNVIQTFDENPRLGILSPPMPNHGTFRALYGHEWGPNFENTKKLAEELNINVPMDERKKAIAPYGTFFWFRPKALHLLFKKDWQYKDFPPEPNLIDGTILHAIERLYPFAAQAAGYYPGIVMSDDFAAIEYTNLSYYLTSEKYDLRTQLDEERNQIHEMYKTSTSWKVSAPIRLVGEVAKKIKRK